MGSMWLLFLIIVIPMIIYLIAIMTKVATAPMDNSPLNPLLVEEIKKCAELSSLAYDNIPGATYINDPTGQYDAATYMFQQGHKVYIVFKGTSNNKDVKQDLNRDLVEISSGIMVHEGMYNSYKSVQPIIMETLASYKNYNRIISTGHSLGAGFATINTYYLLDNEKRVECYTYGCPRVGNYNFAKLFEGRDNMIRIYDFTDPVPMVPTNSNYFHTFNKSMCINGTGHYDYKPRDHYPSISRQFFIFLITKWNNRFDTHDISTYISHIDKLPTYKPDYKTNN